MTKRYAVVAFLVVALALFFGLHCSVLGVNQGGTAHGQQGANLALAEGFVDNGLDFFTPETKALNYRNGDYSVNKTSATGITAAHFPIHAYIPAVVHSITNWRLSKVVQWYNLLWGFLGLFFVYLLALRITNHIGKALFVIVFVGTAPVFAFYQSNFLPEIPAISLVIIGAYLMYRWMQEKTERFAWLGMVAFLFACLPSPDLVWYLVGAGYLIYLNMPRKKNFYGQPVVYALLFFVVLMISERRFDSLRRNYGSQFAGWLQDWTYDQSMTNSLIGNWKLHYFTVFQTVTIAVVVIFVLVLFVQAKHWKIVDRSKYRFGFIIVFPVWAVISSPYQSLYSDVFFLKYLLIPAIFALIVIVDQMNLKVVEKYPRFSTAGFILILFILISEGNWTQNVRKELNRTSPGSNLAFTFQGGDELLLKHGVKASDPLSVVVPNNLGIGQEVLGYLDHKGIIRETPNGEELVPAFSKDHYVVCHVDAKETLYDQFKTNFEELGDNGSIVLFKVID